MRKFNKQKLNINVLILFSLFVLVSCMSYKPYKVETRYSDNTQGKLQKILDEAVNLFKLPGVQAGIYLPDNRIVLASSGTIDFERNMEKITNNTIFRIGSTTKMFISALINKQIENGLLEYDKTLDTWLPEIEGTKDITIEELLNHTSGISETLFKSPNILIKSVIFSHLRWDSREVISKIMDDMKIVPKKDRGFKYSNNNYLILGLVAEKIGNEKLDILLKNKLFKPLKMDNTYLLPYYRTLPGGLILGYDEYIPFGPHKIPPDNTSWDTVTFSAGAMASSAKDLLIWLNNFFHNKLIKKETFLRMNTFVDASDNGRDNNIIAYGLGVAKYKVDGKILVGHPGAGFGGECYAFYYPKKDISIVVSYNWSKKDNPAGKEIIKRILDEIIEE